MKWDVPCPHEAEYEALRPVVCQHCANDEIARLRARVDELSGELRWYDTGCVVLRSWDEEQRMDREGKLCNCRGCRTCRVLRAEGE